MKLVLCIFCAIEYSVKVKRPFTALYWYQGSFSYSITLVSQSLSILYVTFVVYKTKGGLRRQLPW